MTVEAPTRRQPAAARAPTVSAPRRHRVLGVALVIVGVHLVVLPFALSLFSRAPDAEAVADRYRDFATEEGLATFSDNTQVVVRGGRQLLDEALPRFAADLGTTESELDADIRRRFPNVAVYQGRAPVVFTYLEPAVAQVAGQADNVEDADDFPAPGVPVTFGPWALLAAGAGLVGLGLWVFVSPRPVAPLALALVVALGLAAAPLALGWPHQVDAAEEVAEAARVAFSPAVAQATTADTYMIDAAVIELEQGLLPYLADRRGRTPTELLADFPDLASFVGRWSDGLSDAGHELSQSQIQFVDEFHNADATPYQVLPWLFVVPGLMLLVVAVGTAVSQGRGDRSPTS